MILVISWIYYTLIKPACILIETVSPSSCHQQNTSNDITGQSDEPTVYQINFCFEFLLRFLLANRNQQCIPVGLSILVTFQSAILFLGVPAEIYTQGTSFLLFQFGMAAAVLLSAFLIVPLLHPLRLTSVYKVRVKEKMRRESKRGK